MKLTKLNFGQHITVLLKILFLLSVLGCKKEEVLETNEDSSYILDIPAGFISPIIPTDNQPTKFRVELGKMLFSDPILSRDSSVSCASCHFGSTMADTTQFSKGIEGRVGERNTPSIINVAYQNTFLWDGGVPTLEQQVLAPIDNHKEFDFDANEIVKRLQKHPIYRDLTIKAYKQEPSVFTLTRAIANFERTLIKANSKYDQYLYGNNVNALNDAEIRGMNIFFGENGECFHCHGGFNFTDNSFRNNGLYEIYPDSGRARITQNPADAGKFKVPSLRNVDLTAPYMHDGSIKTLEEVVKHYVSGGKKHRNKSAILVPLKLTEQEQKDLVSFLKTLSNQ